MACSKVLLMDLVLGRSWPTWATLITMPSRSSSIARQDGMAQRRGLGKTRHVATRYLWLHQKQAQNEVKLTKIRGTDNDADILTKHVDEGTMNKMLEQMSFEYRHGRSAAATRSLRIKTCNEGLSQRLGG